MKEMDGRDNTKVMQDMATHIGTPSKANDTYDKTQEGDKL